jgi:hypothetical protein
MSKAWPVPKATTLMSMPVAFLNSGNKCPNNPDCSVEVVDDITMDWAKPWELKAQTESPKVMARSHVV